MGALARLNFTPPLARVLPPTSLRVRFFPASENGELHCWNYLNTTFPGESASIMWKLGHIVDVHNFRLISYSFTSLTLSKGITFSPAQDHCFLFPEISRSFHFHYNRLHPQISGGSPDMFCSCSSSIPRKTRPPFYFLQTTCGGPSFFIPPSIRHGNKGIIVDRW